ncbi:zinc-binding dehydrogenase [Parasphingorhabdus sp.]|uniref:zinc-binding dehydrogenase n=1 Tax=Parasphingorhabdus sp. TaxID=2709688 RepID=UPI003A8FEEC7
METQMKAAILREFGSPLTVEMLPAPVLGTGEVIVDIAAAPVLNYAAEVLSGARQYLLNLPAVPGPGAIGQVRAIGADATHLAVGDWVWCDPTFRSRDDAPYPDITLQGWSARGPGGLRLQDLFGHGTWAEQTLIPTENAILIGDISPDDAPSWCKIGAFLVPYGGLLAADLKAGETVLISGATGGFGSAGVATALAMGAGAVVATGRNAKALADLKDRFGARVFPVQMTGEEEVDRSAIQAAAPGEIDVVLDILPPAALPSQARAAIMAVRPYGRVVLMGGIGMEGGGILELPYVWIMRNCVSIIGNWMYDATAPRDMVKLIKSGLIDIDNYQIQPFPLEQAPEAVAHAARHAGPFELTVLRP